jgi:hypothetical protein
MLKKLINRVTVGLFMVLALSGCSAVRGIGDALINSFKGFSVPFR